MKHTFTTEIWFYMYNIVCKVSNINSLDRHIKCTKYLIKERTKYSGTQVSGKTMMGLSLSLTSTFLLRKDQSAHNTQSWKEAHYQFAPNTLGIILVFQSLTLSNQLLRFATIQTNTSLSRTNVLCTYYFSCPVKFPKSVKSLNGLTLYHHPVTAQVVQVTKKQYCASTQVRQPRNSTALYFYIYIWNKLNKTLGK